MGLCLAAALSLFMGSTIVEETDSSLGGEAVPASTEEATPASTASEPAAPTSQEPTALQKWWNGEESIYSNGMYLNFGLVTGSHNGDTLRGDGIDGAGSSLPLKDATVSGFQGDIGVTGRYFTMLAFGASYYTSGDDAFLGAAPVSITGVDLRLLQPGARYALWRFELSARLGPVVHLGWVQAEESRIPSGVPVDSMTKDLMDSSLYGSLDLEAGVGLRFYPLSFIYADLGYQHSFALLNFLGEIDGMNWFRFGAGLSF